MADGVRHTGQESADVTRAGYARSRDGEYVV